MPIDNSRLERERQHFDALVDKTNNVWWGNLTHAGKKRMQRRINLIQNRIKTFNNPYILEIGCGTGVLTRLILEQIPECKLNSCDISPKSIQLAQNYCSPYKNVTFNIEDACKLSHPSETFNAIVGNAVLHHVNLEDTLKECWRLLLPAGSILFFEPNMLNPQIAIERNIKFVGRMLQNSPDETAFIRWNIEKTLKNSGFKNVMVTPFDFLYPAIPETLIPFMEKLGDVLEAVPILKEISGSLIISGDK